jgi:SnoaL-like polyketide cyclase
VTTRDSVAIVENFWREVWQQPQNPDAIDKFVDEDFIITSGGTEIRSRGAFKAWVKNFQSLVQDFEFHSVETFQNEDGSRVASRWRVTGRNNGLMGTEPNGAPFEMTGTAVWAELQAHDVERPGERLQLHVDMNRAVLIDSATELML